MKPPGAPLGCCSVYSYRGQVEGGIVNHSCILCVDQVVTLDRQRAALYWQQLGLPGACLQIVCWRSPVPPGRFWLRPWWLPCLQRFKSDPALVNLKHTVIASWYQRKGYLTAMADLIQQELQRFQRMVRRRRQPSILLAMAFHVSTGWPISIMTCLRLHCCRPA